jgi:DNA-binding CsgD family transcriptional regulator
LVDFGDRRAGSATIGPVGAPSSFAGETVSASGGRLLGRAAERLALDRLFAEASAGRSGVLALVGEAGIGKTSLLEYAAARAEGMQVLRARGVESEADVPFAGLAELLRPALTAIDRIPELQAQALSGALALAPASALDRFAIGAATLSLLSAYSDDAPVALLVDDAHNLDGSSADALLFAARRLVADPIALVFTVREGEPSLLDGADLRVLHVPGLDRADAEELLRRAEVTGDAAERLYQATGGNPLALLELASESDRLTPGEGPVPISTRIAEAFSRRLESLPEETRRLLLLAAAGDPRDAAALARAAGAEGLELTALTAAEEAGLVRLESGRVEFRHPLVRSAVYADASPHDRRGAHAALAAALPDRDVDKRAWHLAAASVGPDEHAAAALEQAGLRARARSAYGVAAAAFEHAARLAPSDEPRLALEAAEAASLAGDDAHALALLGAAGGDLDDAALAARVDRLHGRLALRRGPVMDSYPFFVAGAERIASADPEAAVGMLAEAALAAFYAGDMAAMLAAEQRAEELARGVDTPRSAFFAANARAIAFVLAGRGDAGARAAREAIRILEASDELRDDPRLLGWAALAPLWLREAETGRSLIALAVDRARSQAAIGVLPGLLNYLARDQSTTDQWAAAQASYDEGMRLARELGQRAEYAVALGGRAWLEARMGREQACREHAAEAASLCEELGIGTLGLWTLAALGDLELGLGRPEEAARHYERQAAELDARGIADADLSPAPELVETYLRLGRTGDAERTSARFVVSAEGKGQAWALARAARCRGLLGDAEAFDEALALHAQTADLYETARTQLAYGARLRRSRKRVLAREQLRAAVESFDALGAPMWAEQARAELLATGETARRRDAGTLDQLTPQELQIARLLAEGKTTREAAAAVFLSPKTVEYHLRHVYQKLGISSREELAYRFGGSEPA